MALLSGLHKALMNDTADPIMDPISQGQIAIATGMRHLIDGVTSSTGYMSPNQPMVPVAPPGTLPRTFDYPFGTNLYFQPRQEQPGSVDFNTLRQLARYDIVRLCIETRKAQMLEMPQMWRVKMESGESKVAHKARNAGDKRIGFLNDFFYRPDKQYDFLDWMNMLIEEVLVTDALSIWPVLDEDFEILGLRLIDGATVKPLIDMQGWRPAPPNPAYQQIIKGSPALDMTSGLCLDCKVGKRTLNSDGKQHRCLPLVYKPFNPTVSRLYGYSPVEQIINTILIGMNRMVSQQALYTEGNVPEMIISLSAEMGAQQILQFQAFFDELKGNVALKRRVRFIPEAKSITQTKDPMIKDDRDDWLARVSCYAFSVAPNALVKQMNRASSQQIQQSAVEEGKLPTLGRISATLTGCVREYFGDEFGDIEHVYDTSAESDPATQSKIFDMGVRNCTTTLNEVRDDQGKEPYEGDIGDKPIVFLPTGPVFLEEALEIGMQPPAPPPGFGGNPDDDTAGGTSGPPSNGGGKAPSSKNPNSGGAPSKGFGKPSKSAKGGEKKQDLSAVSKKEVQKLLKLLPVGGSENEPRPFVALSTELEKVKKPSESDAARKARKKIQKALEENLDALSDSVSSEASKAYGDGESTDEIVDSLDLDDAHDPVIEDVTDALNASFLTAGKTALETLQVTNENLFDLFNKDARDYARARGAELVGKKWDADGKLVDNPDSQWAITETTREGIRDLIAKSYEDGKTPAELKQQIRDSFYFSKGRAQMIAQTETNAASSQGSLGGWKRSGVVLGKSWQTSNNPDVCDECSDNEDEGVIGIDDDFSSGDDAPPAHVNCRCVLSPSLEAPAEKLLKGGPGSGPHPGTGKKIIAWVQHPVIGVHSKAASATAKPAARPTHYRVLDQAHAATGKKLKYDAVNRGYAQTNGDFARIATHAAPSEIDWTHGDRAMLDQAAVESHLRDNYGIKNVYWDAAIKVVEHDALEKGNEDEERDEHGRWTTGGSEEPVKIVLSERAQRALAARVPCNVEKQRTADQQEAIVSRALGLERTRDNSAFDFRDEKIAVELKTMVDAKNDKITMSKTALARKLNEQKKDALIGYTVVADKRGGNTKYYYRAGFGSFRVGAMTPVSLADLRSIIRGKNL